MSGFVHNFATKPRTFDEIFHIGGLFSIYYFCLFVCKTGVPFGDSPEFNAALLLISPAS